MFDTFVTSIRSDRKCFNISANYNAGNLCSFFPDCINHHLLLELIITNGSHVTHVEGKNVTEIVVEIPDICLCEQEEAPGINIAAIVVLSLLVIIAVVCILALILIMRCRKYRKNEKKK